jgi:protein-disulfide isomerase
MPPDPPAAASVQERRLTGSFPLASAGFSRGDPSAPLTIYEISDFGCRFCGVFAREEYPALGSEFVESGRVRWVFIPTEGASANGAEAARAAVCAGEQERFWEMHRALFADQRAWMRPRDPSGVLRSMALAAGVEPENFDRCYAGEVARERLRRSSRLSLLLGIRATPSFFIDGRIVEGALRAAQFAELIRRTERAGSGG